MKYKYCSEREQPFARAWARLDTLLHEMRGSVGLLMTNKSYRKAAAVYSISLLASSTGFSQKVVQEVRLMDYFYPPNRQAVWTYLTGKENGGYDVTRVRVNAPSMELNLFRIEKGRLVDYNKRVLWMCTSNGKYSGGDFDFDDSEVKSNDFYGLRSNYAIYGFDDNESNTYVRFSPGAVFPEKFRVMQSVSVSTGMFDSEGRAGPDATLSAQLLGREAVTVPAGTFRDCIHLRFTISFKGGPIRSEDEWWARGVGVIKTKTTKARGRTAIAKLQSYELPYEETLRFYRPSGDFGWVFADPTGTSIYSWRTKVFRVKNHGKTTVPGLSISITGSNSFTCNRLDTGKLAPGEMAEFDVTFAAREVSSYRAVLKVQERDNPANSCQVRLRGVGEL